MAERIGVEAVVDLTRFDRGVGLYLVGLNRMDSATGAFVNSVSRQFDLLGKLTLGIGSGLILTALNLSRQGTRLFQDFTTEAVKDSAELQNIMAGVAASMNTTLEAIRPLSEEAVRLGVNPRLKVTTFEVADAMLVLAKNGVTTTQMLDGAAEASIALANATGGDLALAADVVTDVMGIFEIEASEVERIINGVTGTVNNSKFSLEDYFIALSNGGAILDGTGGTFEDFNTTIALTSKAFNSGRRAGTGFAQFLVRLPGITEKAIEKMKELGIIISDVAGIDAGDAQLQQLEQLRGKYGQLEDEIRDYQLGLRGMGMTDKERVDKINSLKTELAGMSPELQTLEEMFLNASKTSDKVGNRFFDAEGKFLGLENAAMVLRETLSGLSDIERSIAIKEIFGVDAQETVIELMDKGAEGFREYQALIAQTDAFAAAETRMRTLAGEVEILGGEFEAISITIGDHFNPIASKLVRHLNKVLEANRKGIADAWIPTAKAIEGLVDTLIPLIDAHMPDLIAIVVDVNKIMAKMIDNLAETAIRWFPAIISGIRAIVRWFTEFFTTGKVFNEAFGNLPRFIQKAITATMEMIENFKRAKDAVLELSRHVIHAVRPIIDWIRQNVKLSDVLTVFGLSLVAVLAPIALLIARIALLVTTAAVVISALRQYFDVELKDIFKVAALIAERINRILTFVVRGEWENAWAEIVRNLKDIWNFISDLIQSVDWERVWGKIKDFAVDAFGKLWDYLMSLPWDEWWEKALDLGETALDRLIDYIQGLPWGEWWEIAVREGKIAFDSLVEYIINLPWEDWWGVAVQKSAEAFSKLVELATPYVLELRDFIIKKYNEFIEFIRTYDYKGLFDKLWEEFETRFPKTAAFIEEVVRQVQIFIDKIREYLPVVEKFIGDVIKQFNRFKDYLENTLIPEVIKWYKDIFTAEGSGVYGDTPIDVFKTKIQKFMEWVNEKFIPTVVAWYKDLFTAEGSGVEGDTPIDKYKLKWEATEKAIGEFVSYVNDVIDDLFKPGGSGVEGDTVIDEYRERWEKAKIAIGLFMEFLVDVYEDLFKPGGSGEFGDTPIDEFLSRWENTKFAITLFQRWIKDVYADLFTVEGSGVEGDTPVDVYRQKWALLKQQIEEFFGPIAEFMEENVNVADVLGGGVFAAATLLKLRSPLLRFTGWLIVGTVAVSAFRNAIETDFAGINTFLTKASEELSGILQAVWDAFGLMAKEVGIDLGTLEEVTINIFAGILTVLQMVRISIENFNKWAKSGGLKETADAFMEGIGPILGAIAAIQDFLSWFGTHEEMGQGVINLETSKLGVMEALKGLTELEGAAKDQSLIDYYRSLFALADDKSFADLAESVSTIDPSTWGFWITGEARSKEFQRHLYNFADEVEDVARAINQGILDANHTGIKEFIKSSAQYNLIAEEEGLKIAQSLLDSLSKDKVDLFGEAGKEVVSEYGEGASSKIPSVTEDINSSFVDLWQKNREMLKIEALKSGEESVASYGTGGEKQAPLSLFSLGKELASETGSHLGNIYYAWKEGGVEHVEGYGLGGLSEVPSTFFDLGKALLGELGSKAGDVKNAWMLTGEESITDYGEGGKQQTEPSTGSLIKGMLTSLGQKIVSVTDLFGQSGVGSITEFADKFGTNRPVAEGEAEALAKELIDVAVGIESGFLESGEGSVKGYAQGILENKGLASDETIDFATSVIEAARSVLKTRGTGGYSLEFADMGGGAVAGFNEGFTEMSTETQGIVSSWTLSIMSQTSILAVEMQKLAEGIKDTWVGSFTEMLVESYNAFVPWTDAMGRRLDIIIGAFRTYGEFIKKEWVTAFYDMLQESYESFVPWANDVGNRLETVIDGIEFYTGRIYDTWITAFYDMLQDSYEAFVPWANDMGNRLETVIDGIEYYTERINKTWTTAFYDMLQESYESFVSWANDMGNRLETIVSGIEYYVGRIKDAWVDGFSSMLVDSYNLLQPFQDALKRKLDEIVGIVAEFGNKLRNALVEAFAGLDEAVESSIDVNRFRSVGENIVQSFIDGVGSKIGDAQNKVNELMTISQQAAETAAQIGSPSKIWGRMGANVAGSFIGAWVNRMRGFRNTVFSEFNTMASIGSGFAPRNYTPAVTSYSRTNNIGPFNVYNQMDAAHMEFMIRRIVAEEIG